MTVRSVGNEMSSGLLISGPIPFSPATLPSLVLQRTRSPSTDGSKGSKLRPSGLQTTGVPSMGFGRRGFNPQFSSPLDKQLHYVHVSLLKKVHSQEFSLSHRLEITAVQVQWSVSPSHDDSAILIQSVPVVVLEHTGFLGQSNAFSSFEVIGFLEQLNVVFSFEVMELLLSSKTFFTFEAISV